MDFTVMVLFGYLNFLQRYRCLSGDGKCSTQLSNGDTYWFCCDNHANVNGSCVECSDGYLSDNGEACHPCLNGLFGRKCGERCICKDYQECHNIDGCRNRSYISVTTMFSESPTFTPVTNDTSLKPEIIYIICTCVLSFLVILSIILLRHNIQQQCVSKFKIGNSRNETKELNELNTANPVGIYDYADESNVVDLDLEANQTGNNKETNKYSNDSSGDVNNDQEHDDEQNLTLSDGYLKAHSSADSSCERQRETVIEEGAAFSKYNNIDDKIVPTNSDEHETFQGKEENELTLKYIGMPKPYACSADVHRSFSENDTAITSTNGDIDTNASTDVSA